MKRFFPVCLAIFTLISCTARIDGSLAADGSAVLSVNMSLEPRMTALIRSLSAAGGQSDGPVLDGQAIAMSMSETPGISYVTFRNTSAAAIEGQIRINNVSDFLAAADFITFEQGASGGRCLIGINRDNGPVIVELLSEEIADYLNALMAPLATGEEMTKSEYLDLVAMFYNRTISEEIAGSRIRASFEFPGPVTSVSAPGLAQERGGAFSGRRATFDIPLLDLLVLETPLIYEVNWN